MPTRLFFISAAICAAAAYGAYSQQVRYDPNAEVRKNALAREQFARSWAADQMEKQRHCLATENGESNEPCGHNTYEQYVQIARSWNRESPYVLVNDTATRNVYLLVAAISGAVAFSQLRKKKDRNGASISSGPAVSMRQIAAAASTTREPSAPVRLGPNGEKQKAMALTAAVVMAIGVLGFAFGVLRQNSDKSVVENGSTAKRAAATPVNKTAP